MQIYANVVPQPVPDSNFLQVTVPRYTVEPTLTLIAGSDFNVRTVVIDEEIPDAARLEADVDVSLPVGADTWVVAVVKGSDGVSRPLWPMNPQDLIEEGNLTLAELTDGNLGEGGNTALAYTNPLFIDADGNGRFDAPSGVSRLASGVSGLRK